MNKLIVIILVIVLLSQPLSNSANAFYGYVPPPEFFVAALVVIVAIVYVAVSAPNLLPVPPSAPIGKTFSFPEYPPAHYFVSHKLPKEFGLIEERNYLLYKELVVRAPTAEGYYEYEKNVLGLPFNRQISILSEREYNAGIFNPTKPDFNRNPIVGGALQTVLFPIGFGYLYADEVSVESGWQMQKCLLLAVVSAYLYSVANTAGIKTSENTGLYLGLGSIALTTFDVVRIINAKNSIAREMRKGD